MRAGQVETYLTYFDVCGRYKIGITTFYRWIAEGRLPQGYQFGKNCVRWKLSELVEFENKHLRVEV